MMNFKIIQLLFSMFMIAKLSFISPQSCFSSHEGGTVSVACSSGLKITAVNFASYGTPTGTCGAYNISSCHAPSSYSVVANACINQPSCSIDAKNKVFGDPCDGDFKHLYVQVTCSSELIITAVNVASYGTPNSSCHAPSSNACSNQPSCLFDANCKVFGDQCDGDFKRDEQLKPSIVPTYLNSPTSDPSSSPTTDTPTSTLSTSSTKMITNDDFIQAAQVGDLQRLKELIAEWKVAGDFDINATNKKGATALMLASYAGHFDIVKFLVTKGVDINVKDNNGATALMASSQAGHLNIVQFLVSQKADVNARANDGVTALWCASSQGHIDIVKFLVTQKADVNAHADVGSTVLMAAIVRGHIEVVQYLVTKGGADVDAKTESNMTALMFASSIGHFDIVKILVIDGGADVNAKYETGDTALMAASTKGYQDIVKYLVEVGADSEAINTYEHDAAWMAKQAGHTEIVVYLKLKREEKEKGVADMPSNRYAPIRYIFVLTKEKIKIWLLCFIVIVFTAWFVWRKFKSKPATNAINANNNVDSFVQNAQVDDLHKDEKSIDDEEVVNVMAMAPNNAQMMKAPLEKGEDDQHNDDDEDYIKPLSELSVNEVTRLLESLNLTQYCAAFEENRIDGPTLMNCKTEEDVVELGIPLRVTRAKARVLLNEITKRKETESEENEAPPVPEIINCDKQTVITDELSVDS